MGDGGRKLRLDSDEVSAASGNGRGAAVVHFLLAAASLWQREVVRFMRQPSRIIGAFGAPFLFWVLIGSGLGRSFQMTDLGVDSDVHYLQYFFPGTLLLMVIFTSIFGSYSLIEDRKEGFLQSVMVSSASRGSIVLGNVLGGATLALLQGLLFAALAPAIGLSMELSTGFLLAGVIFLIALGQSALGFLLAWPMHSTQGYHSVTNLLLMPMWFLSGALFPVAGAAEWVQWLMKLNPVTYGLNLLRHTLAPEQLPADTSLTVSWIVTILFTLLLYGLAWIIIHRPQIRRR